MKKNKIGRKPSGNISILVRCKSNQVEEIREYARNLDNPPKSKDTNKYTTDEIIEILKQFIIEINSKKAS